jgi:hypothetical protein
MRDLAPPVSRGEFYYNGRGIFVVIEGINYHREDPRRLHTLLTHVRGQPLLTKAGVVSKRKPPKSKPVEFYIAQLMHYGLKIYKTKDVAKKHLLQSFNLATGTITIPQNIQKLEKEMKKEWDKNNESANKKADEELEKRRKAAADRIAALEVKPTAKSAANLAATQSLKADAPRSASKKKTNTAADRKLIEKIIQLSQEPLKKLLLDLLIQAPDAGKTLEELMKQHTVANDPKKAPSNSLVSHPLSILRYSLTKTLVLQQTARRTGTTAKKTGIPVGRHSSHLSHYLIYSRRSSSSRLKKPLLPRSRSVVFAPTASAQD